MRVLVSGSHGMVGSAFINSLEKKREPVFRLLRLSSSSDAAAAPSDVLWDPQTGQIDSSRLEGFDAVVHLAGESIAAGRWTAAKKERIRTSRVGPTRHLSEALAKLNRPPRILVCASAIGFYGDRGAELLTEESHVGTGFLSEVCREWENAAEPARAKGIRVVNLRIGIILSSRGGALSQMLLPFKLGVGGKIGDGSQFMSWIGLEDVVDVIQYAIQKEKVTGPVNVVSPQAVTNAEFTKTLGRVLKRPTAFPLPKTIARIALGEMVDALLFSSTRVAPGVLESSGFRFRNSDLEASIRHALIHHDGQRS